MSSAPDFATSNASCVASQVAGWIGEHRARLLSDLQRLVGMDSPSVSHGSLRATADMLEEYFAPVGTVRRIGEPPSLLVEVGKVSAGRPPLLMSHYDTVWEDGTAARWPMTVKDGWVHGPGVLDMKGDIVLVRHVLDGLAATGAELRRGVRVLMSCDEEILNPHSERFVAEAARQCGAALVAEPPLAEGQLKTARKGYALARCEVRGRAAHAGIEPEKGISAAVEAAHFTLAAHALNRLSEGTSVNVGTLRSGGRPNIVPPSAELEVEVRSYSEQEMTRVLDALAAKRPHAEGAELAISVEGRRVPMPRTKATGILFDLASEIATGLGLQLSEAPTGGVSEGNIAQAEGAPTLDGLGLIGVGAHTEEESFRLDCLESRGGLLAGLLVALSEATDEQLDDLRQATSER